MVNLLVCVTGLWLCGLVTGGPPDIQQDPPDALTTAQPHHVGIFEKLQQQADEITDLKTQVSLQTASLSSQTAEIRPPTTLQHSSSDASPDNRADVSIMEAELHQQAREIGELKALVASQAASFSSQLAAIRSQMAVEQPLSELDRAVRSDSASTMEVELQRQASEISSLKAQITSLTDQLALVSSPLAFSGKHSGIQAYTDGDVVLFNQVITNVGGIYDPPSGAVTVSQDGVYLVFLRVDSLDGPNGWMRLQLKVNNVSRGMAYADHGTANGLALAFNLSAGDRVNVVKSAGTSNPIEIAPELFIVRVSA